MPGKPFSNPTESMSFSKTNNLIHKTAVLNLNYVIVTSFHKFLIDYNPFPYYAYILIENNRNDPVQHYA